MSDHYDRYNGMEELLGTNLAEVGMGTISRQQAIDAFNTDVDSLIVYGTENAVTVKRYLNGVLEKIKDLPSAEPKRGKWKNIVEGIEYDWGTCDMCGARFPMPYKYYEYCPHCGADMRQKGENNESN